MNHRTPLLLLTVTVLMALTIAIFLPPWNSHPQPGAGTSLVPDSKSIESIEMTSQEVGSSHWTRLARTPGGSWKVQDKSGNSFPAQEPMVEQLLAQLTQPWKRIATPPDPDSQEGKKTLASMGLTTPQLTVSMRALNQPEPITIHLGAHLAESTSMYASSSDFRNVGLAPWDTYRLANQPVHAWINRQFAPVIPASVTSIEVQSNQGNTSLTRDAVTGIWQVVDPIIDTADHLAIETHLVELSRSTALEYRGEADTFDTEFALKLTIHQAPDVTRELIWEKIHRPPDDPAEAGEPDLFLVHDKSSPYRAIVTGEAVEDWALSSDHFRDRRMLLFSQSSIQKVQIDIFGKSGFSIEKSSGEQWQILGDNISTPIPADSGQVADFLNLAQSLRISSFPDIPWDKASSIGLAPPRAAYSFWSQPTPQQDPVMIAQLNLGSLDTEREILYAAHNRTNRIHTLSPVHALSLPREYFPLRSRKLLPGILSTQITRLSWSGQSGEIQLTRNPNGTWANLDPIESEAIIDFCADLAGFEVDSWRTFGTDALKNFDIDPDDADQLTLEIFLDGEESVVIRHGKRSPRRGIYSSIDYEDGPYVFAFPLDMLEKLMLLSELRQIYQSP